MLQHDGEGHSGGDSESGAGNSIRPAVWHCVVAALAVAGGIWLRLAFNPILGKHSPFLLFPIVILVAARFGGWLPGLVAPILTTLGSWFFLIDPSNTFYIADKAEAESLAAYANLLRPLACLAAKYTQRFCRRREARRRRGKVNPWRPLSGHVDHNVGP
jgi:K+-sensing histidine kinase KdpD